MAERLAERVDLAPAEEFVTAARAVMGGIDFDPYSTRTINRVVLAKRFLDRDKLGLDGIMSAEWKPPGTGRTVAAPPISVVATRRVIARTLAEYQKGTISQAMLLLGANETLRTEPWIWDLPVCIPFRRLRPRYWDEECEIFRTMSPSNWGCIVYLPPVGDGEVFEEHLARFHQAVFPIGRVIWNEFSGDRRWRAAYREALGREFREVR